MAGRSTRIIQPLKVTLGLPIINDAATSCREAIRINLRSEFAVTLPRREGDFKEVST